jgi:alginate O-acetyltransferase complex protein AlgI
MLFNSIHFAIFLPVVFLIYWFLAKRNLKSQNLWLLICSYFFYSCWDWRFLFLLMFSTLLDYYSGIKIWESGNRKNKKMWLWLSITLNLSFLCLFKYFNFFSESFASAGSMVGIETDPIILDVILPVGISFYTFHGLSYILDVYHEKIVPERDPVTYSLFVSFFPLLVAGPIERATHLLPQLKERRVFNYAGCVDGLRQILWGLFKKIVIADSCAEWVKIAFENTPEQSGSSLLAGAILFAFQIYCDFSGYSDIALGTARLFGIELLRNFSYPYFSRDIAEFWRKWHISLSSWFRDYVYIPLGGSRTTPDKKVRNVLIIFLLSGFWHGANWTFIAWGLLNALYFLPLVLSKKNRLNVGSVEEIQGLPSWRNLFSILFTFMQTVLAWIFFRAHDIGHAIDYYRLMFSRSLFSIPEIAPLGLTVLIIFLIMVEWLGRKNKYALENLGKGWMQPVRWTFYLTIGILIFLYHGKQETFIYFQF